MADKPPRPIVGTKAFIDPVDMTAKLFRAVGFRVDIEEVMHPDGRVVIFNIPGRPRGTAYAHEGAYLMRVGEELHPMTEDQLRNIFAEGQPDWFERAAESGLTGQKLESERLIESKENGFDVLNICLLYTSPSPRDRTRSRMPSSA